jgi:hypothetical protein
MGIKFGSVILTILFLFVAKISFEATTDSLSTPANNNRTPASIGQANSIDHDYAVHMQGHHPKH